MPLPSHSSTEQIGHGSCDGCGGEGDLTAFDVAGVAVGICLCERCMWETENAREAELRSSEEARDAT